MTPDLAMIYLFASNVQPSGYAFCSGQSLAISGNTALFSLIGTYYGGDGVSTFLLPDLRGRAPVHTGGNAGQGPGLSTYGLGQVGGKELVTLNTNQIPAHTHSFIVNNSAGRAATATAGADYIAGGPVTGSEPNASALKTFITDATPSNLVPLIGTAVSSVGSSKAHSNLQPYLALNYVIALQGGSRGIKKISSEGISLSHLVIKSLGWRRFTIYQMT